jgi:dihydroorotate dehydrogenase
VDAERVHGLAMDALAVATPALRLAAPLVALADPRLEQRVFGLRFPNPVGLAAGFDKTARAVPAWPALGFGFAEIGTVTYHAQAGNAPPRLFRLPDDEAIVNRLGFNNLGAAATAARLAAWERRAPGRVAPLGVNIGKSRVAPIDGAAADYVASLDLLWPYADYVVVNVSSPNTPGLRRLQDRDRLEEVLGALLARGHRRPLLVKVAPDLGAEALDEVVDLALELGLDGLVVANTTVSRSGLASPAESILVEGGLSGRPLRARSTELVRRAACRAEGRLPIVGVGGVATAADVWEKLRAGASLVQLYTAMVYRGPAIARELNRGLLELMEREEVGSIAEVVGGDLG